MLQPLIVMCQVFNGILVHFADCDSDIAELFSDAYNRLVEVINSLIYPTFQLVA